MPRFAANLGYLFTERPMLERVGAAARAGFPAIELQFPYEIRVATMRAEIEKHSLTVLGINTERGGGKGEFGLGAVPGREHDFELLMRQAADYVAAAGGNAVHALAGHVEPSKRGTAEETFVANLRLAADIAAEKKLNVLLEPINDRDRPNYFLSRVEHAADIIARVGKPNVKIQYDFYHVAVMQGDVLRRFERHREVIGHVQIGAVPSRHEPDGGEVDYPAVFGALDALGYDGWIACEYHPRGRTEDGLGWARKYGVVPKP